MSIYNPDIGQINQDGGAQVLKDDRNYGVPIFPDTDALEIVSGVNALSVRTAYLEDGKILVAYMNEEPSNTLEVRVVNNCLSENPTVGAADTIAVTNTRPFCLVAENSSTAWLFYQKVAGGNITYTKVTISGNTATIGAETLFSGTGGTFGVAYMEALLTDTNQITVAYRTEDGSTSRPLVSLRTLYDIDSTPAVSAAEDSTATSTSGASYIYANVIQLTTDRVVVVTNEPQLRVILFSGISTNSPSEVDDIGFTTIVDEVIAMGDGSADSIMVFGTDSSDDLRRCAFTGLGTGTVAQGSVSTGQYAEFANQAALHQQPYELNGSNRVCLLGDSHIALMEVSDGKASLKGIAPLDPKSDDVDTDIKYRTVGQDGSCFVKLDSAGKYFACVYPEADTPEDIYMTRYR